MVIRVDYLYYPLYYSLVGYVVCSLNNAFILGIVIMCSLCSLTIFIRFPSSRISNLSPKKFEFCFRVYDLDGNGLLSSDEYRQLEAKNCEKWDMPKEQLEQHCRVATKDFFSAAKTRDLLSPDGQLSPPASGGVERRFQSMSVSQADMQRGRSNSGGATAPWMIPGQQPGGMRGSLGQPGAGSIHGYGVSASPPGQSMYGQSGAAAAAQKKSFWSKAKSAKLGRASMSVIPDRRSIYDE